MVRIEQSRVFPVDREAGFDYITEPDQLAELLARSRRHPGPRPDEVEGTG